MKKKIAQAIKSYYLKRFDNYEMSPNEIAELVCKVIRESLPAKYDDKLDLNPEYTNGWDDYRSELIKLLGGEK